MRSFAIEPYQFVFGLIDVICCPRILERANTLFRKPNQYTSFSTTCAQIIKLLI